MPVRIPEADSYVVIGIPKCGTVSMAEYLKKKFPKAAVTRVELIYDPKGIDYYQTYHKGWKPVIITRDPADRIWTAYHFWKFMDRMEFDQFLHYVDPIMNNVGCNNPIAQSDYDRYIEKWKAFDPVVVSLEQMSREKDFPHLQRTQEVKNITIEEMPKFYRDIVKKALNIYRERQLRIRQLPPEKQKKEEKKYREEIMRAQPQRTRFDWDKFNQM